MSNLIPPPPTAQLPVLTDSQGSTSFNPLWLQWLIQLVATLTHFGGAIFNHNTLTGLQSYTNQFGILPLTPQTSGIGTLFFHLGSQDVTVLTGGPTSDASGYHKHWGVLTPTALGPLSSSPFTYTPPRNSTPQVAQDCWFAPGTSGTVTAVNYLDAGGGNTVMPVLPMYHLSFGDSLRLTFTGTLNPISFLAY